MSAPVPDGARRLSGRDGVLRVGIDARLRVGTSGGVEQVVRGLADGLSRLEQGREEYVFLTLQGENDWLHSLAPETFEIVEVASPSSGWERGRRVARWASQQDWLQDVPGLRIPPPPAEPKFVGQLGCDVIHFTKQGAFLTSLPNIYQPHDLQHRHYPEHFTVREAARRESWYGAFSRQANVVAVMTHATKDDVVSAYGVAAGRVAVIGWPPALAAYARPTCSDVDRTRRRFGLPELFAIYPARTWPHKNHLTLVKALRRLRDEHGLEVPVVFTGGETESASEIRSLAERLGVASLVYWLGFVPPSEIFALYCASRCVVYPTLFEGWGLPILEAFYAGTPVACSRGVGFEEFARDAPTYFDPRSDKEIAAAVAQVLRDSEAAKRSAVLGRAIVAEYEWIHVARAFRALYRVLAQRELDEDDRALLVRHDLSPDMLARSAGGR